ncbi:MAG: hypothetical protein FIB02_03195 [Desulfuromonas sp.]|nr:hypothetical protein [Desulfuromonas sp.]
MALWLRDIPLEWGEDPACLPQRVARIVGVTPDRLGNFRIIRRSLDARRKPRLLQVFTVEFGVDDEAGLLLRLSDNPRLQTAIETPLPAPAPGTSPHRALVGGMGPAGLFAALHLAECGVQVTLVERGRPVESRLRDVERFWATGELDVNSNVQFGEGGAGTFSDGKLSTRLNHPWLRHVLATLVACGAQEEILIEAKPHIGTDRLRLVLIRLRERLKILGVELRYETCLTDFDVAGGKIVGGVLDDNELCPCQSLILAPGHSARDTYRMLAERGVALEPKEFAVGVRVEHPRELIDRIQYGNRHPRNVPAADYALRYNDAESGRGVYSFCMCPGGEMINSASEADGVVVNGMSRAERDGLYSNSALVVTVRPADWPHASVLGGVEFQRRIEQAAFRSGGGSFHAPAQNLMAFAGRGEGPCRSSCHPGVRETDLAELLPAFVASGLRRALPHFERQMRGFLTNEAVLVGFETRTSAPLRIARNECGESISHPGLFPAGEGAGYAGGIMSAALDGLKVADRIIQRLHEKECQ